MFNLFYLLCVGLASAQQSNEVDLSKAINQTIKSSPEWKLSILSWQEKEANLLKSKGDYDPKIKASVKRDKDDVPSSSSLDGAGNAKSVKTQTDSLNASLSTKLWTGTEIELPYTLDNKETTSTSTVYKDSYAPSLGLTITQPLVKGFVPSYWGKSVKEKEIELTAGEFEKYEKLNKTIHDVIKLYLDVREKKSTSEIKKSALESAKFNVEMVKAKFKVGSSSSVDLLEAESDLAQKEEQTLNAEKDYEQKWHEFLLKVYGGEVVDAQLASADSFIDQTEKFQIEELDASTWEKILDRRYDYLEGEKKIEKISLQLENSWWDKLPSLDLEGEVTNKGLNDSLGQAHDEMMQSRFTSYSYSLTSEYSILGHAANSAYKMNQLKFDQEKIRQEKLKREVFYQVLDDQKSFFVQKMRIKSYEKALTADREKVDAYVAKFKLGEASAYDVIKAKQSKEESELELMKARIGMIRSFFALKIHQGPLSFVFPDLTHELDSHQFKNDSTDNNNQETPPTILKIDEVNESV